MGKEVIELKGKVTAAEHDKRRVNVEFSDRSAAGTEQVRTNIELALGEAQPIGGLDSHGSSTRIVLTLENDAR